MRLRFALLALLLSSPGVGTACGVCVEDKMAAAYDHAAVTRALAVNRHVAFFHIEGVMVPGVATKQALERIADSSAGVDKGSARVSVESAALAVAFDPKRTPVAALQKNIERRLAAKKLSLMLLQVMDRAAEFSPSVAKALSVRAR